MESHSDLDLNTKDTNTQLHDAVKTSNVKLVQELLNQGADPNRVYPTDPEGTGTILHIAIGGIKNPNLEIISALLQAGSQINARTSEGGTTPLMFAARINNKEVTALLLDKGADPNLQDTKERRTALQYAIAKGNGEIVGLLIANGASPYLTNINQANALHSAIAHNNIEIINMLLDTHPDLVGAPDADCYCLLNETAKKIFMERNLPIYPTHKRLTNLLKETGYVKSDVISKVVEKVFDRGVCLGVSAQAMVDFSDGKKGLERFNNRLSVIGRYSDDELIGLINNAWKLRREITEASKIVIENNLDVLKEITLSDDENLIAVAKVIEAQFPALLLAEKIELAKYFLDKTKQYPSPLFLINSDKILVKKQIYSEKIKLKTQKYIEKEINNNKFFQEKDGQVILEINTMLQNCAIAQDLSKYTELINECAISQNTLVSSSLINSLSVEEKGTKKIGVFTNEYDQPDIKSFLTQIEKIVEEDNIEGVVNFPLCCNDHQVHLAYFGNYEWGYFEINSNPAFLTTDKELLSEEIISSLSEKDDKNKKATICIEVFSSKKNAEKLTTSIEKIKHPDLIVSSENIEPIVGLASSVGDRKAMDSVSEQSPVMGFWVRSLGSMWKFRTAILVISAITSIVALSFTGIPLLLLLVPVISIATFAVWRMNSAETDIRKVEQAEKNVSEQYNEEKLTLGIVKNALESENTVPRDAFPREKSVISRVGYNKLTKKLNKNIQNGLIHFFSQTNANDSIFSMANMFFNQDRIVVDPKDEQHSILFSSHAKKIYAELNSVNKENKKDQDNGKDKDKSDGKDKVKNKSDTEPPEIVLSRAISHAFHAYYNDSILRDPATNLVYKKLINLVDIELTLNKIEDKILLLDKKVHGFFAGTPITLNNKNVVVSHQVAEIYKMIELIRSAKTEKAKLFHLGKILSIGQKESSYFTTSKSLLKVRDDSVWDFFSHLNELLIVKNDAEFHVTKHAKSHTQ